MALLTSETTIDIDLSRDLVRSPGVYEVPIEPKKQKREREMRERGLKLAVAAANERMRARAGQNRRPTKAGN